MPLSPIRRDQGPRFERRPDRKIDQLTAVPNLGQAEKARRGVASEGPHFYRSYNNKHTHAAVGDLRAISQVNHPQPWARAGHAATHSDERHAVPAALRDGKEVEARQERQIAPQGTPPLDTNSTAARETVEGEELVLAEVLE